MTGGVELKRLRDLVRLFDALRMLHEELFRVFDAKIDAMRRADTVAIQTAGDHEQLIVARLKEREGFRKQLMDAIGKDLGTAKPAARSLTVSQLAERLPEPERGLVTTAASRLRAAMATSAQANRVAATVARDVVQHMKWVFAAVRPAEAASQGYTGRGQTVAITDASLFEAVG